MRNILVIGINLNEAEALKKKIENSYKYLSRDIPKKVNVRVESLRTIFKADALHMGIEFYLTDRALITATDEQLLMIKKLACHLRHLKVGEVYD